MQDADGSSSRRRVKIPLLCSREIFTTLFLFFFTVHLTGGTSPQRGVSGGDACFEQKESIRGVGPVNGFPCDAPGLCRGLCGDTGPKRRHG